MQNFFFLKRGRIIDFPSYKRDENQKNCQNLVRIYKNTLKIYFQFMSSSFSLNLFTVYALLLVSVSIGVTPVADTQLQTDNCGPTIAD